MPSNHLILCHPLLLLLSTFPSIIRVFSNESVFRVRWPKYQNFSFSTSTSSECLGLTGLNSLLSKGLSRVFFSTIVWKHHFFSTQLSLWSNSHIHTWLLEKTIALTKWIFVGKVMSLLFNTLSKSVLASFPRSKCLLILWLQSPSAVILEPPKVKSDTFHFFPIYVPWSGGIWCHALHFLNAEV